MSKKKILIADDDLKLLQALKVRLESSGYEVVVTQDAYQGFETARKIKPDLLLLDINMPAGNGFSIQERVAKIEEIAKTPIIFITGDKSQAIKRTALQRGVFAVIHKPFDSAQLLETVAAAIDNAECKQAAERAA